MSTLKNGGAGGLPVYTSLLKDDKARSTGLRLLNSDV